MVPDDENLLAQADEAAARRLDEAAAEEEAAPQVAESDPAPERAAEPAPAEEAAPEPEGVETDEIPVRSWEFTNDQGEKHQLSEQETDYLIRAGLYYQWLEQQRQQGTPEEKKPEPAPEPQAEEDTSELGMLRKELAELKSWRAESVKREEARAQQAKVDAVLGHVDSLLDAAKLKGPDPDINEGHRFMALHLMRQRGLTAEQAVARVQAHERGKLSDANREVLADKASAPKQPGSGGAPAKQGAKKFSTEEVFGKSDEWEEHLLARLAEYES